MRPKKIRKNRKPPPEISIRQPRVHYFYELEVLPGLKELVEIELSAISDLEILVPAEDRDDRLLVDITGHPRRLLQLKRATAVFNLRTYPIPRPRGFLGDVNLKELVQQIRHAMDLSAQPFASFRFGAAGADSTVFQSLRERLESELKLPFDSDNGELVIRFRPSIIEADKWDALVRTTPRPISARPWRVADYPGALNAAIAASMVALTEPAEWDTCINPMCGSGTLLIERALAAQLKKLIGIEVSPAAMECARRNIEAAGLQDRIDLRQGDATAIDMPDRTANVIISDLPWGETIGERSQNEQLYTDFLKEASRIAAPRCRMALLTQDRAALERALAQFGNDWKMIKNFKVFQSGFHPFVFLLHRT
jgi:23S rRNA G2445 N2-methylase RlmL